MISSNRILNPAFLTSSVPKSEFWAKEKAAEGYPSAAHRILLDQTAGSTTGCFSTPHNPAVA
ncbi:hypothetical protein RU97_GL002107 [Enterococcus canis]|uniref:Uncharacterized protein n=1 Tax=Enterococcus canis TaxID=214095 RepID=A0A1L8RE75_9ENTE|nr:hypothetical protein [Enterococcus canis]OJG18034.1 hypothetical protein RU97_GL002107 [Enterococcus canis]